MVDNLGMAYGITGDLDRAEQTFNYGLTQDSTYPMFYYNLACASAERNDMQKSIDLLQKAYSYQSNSIPGEVYPIHAGTTPSSVSWATSDFGNSSIRWPDLLRSSTQNWTCDAQDRSLRHIELCFLDFSVSL